MTIRPRQLLIAATAASAAAMLLAGPASASSERSTMDVTGGVFTCASGNLTITGGTLWSTFHQNTDAQGVTHVTGTSVPHDVTLTDGNGGSYTISGAAWFGGKGVFDQSGGGQPLVLTDTEHFVLHSADGGVFGKVQVVYHFNVATHEFTFDRGTCESPQG